MFTASKHVFLRDRIDYDILRIKNFLSYSLTSSPRADQWSNLMNKMKDSSSCLPSQNISIKTIRNTLLLVVLEKNTIF